MHGWMVAHTAAPFVVAAWLQLERRLLLLLLRKKAHHSLAGHDGLPGKRDHREVVAVADLDHEAVRVMEE